MHIRLTDQQIRDWEMVFPEAVQRGLEAAIPEVRSLAEALTPRLTGELAGSIEVWSTEKGLTVRWGAPHAKYAEYGTVAHEITPHGDYPLAWFRNGKWNFAYRVSHPGYEGWHFVQRVREALMAIVHTLVENAVLQAARGKV